MIPVLAYVVIGVAGLSVLWGLLTTVLDKPPGKAQLLFAAAVELVTVVQSLSAGARLVAGFRPVELTTTIGYLIGIEVRGPVAWFWETIERTLYSGLVLAVAAMAVLGMTLRLLVLWVRA